MRSAALLIAVVACGSAAAQGHATLLDTDVVRVGGALAAAVGTHETALGLRTHIEVPVARRERVAVLVRFDAEVEGLVADLGIPGAGVGGEPGVELAVAFGPAVRVPTADVLRRSVRRHEVAYALVGYLDTDGTSQASGAVRYRLATPSTVFEVAYENDALAHRLRDEFRTAAVRVAVVRTDGPAPVGLGLRLALWTGTTAGLGRLTRDEVYDLSGQLGGDATHGVLALDAIRGGLTVSLGVDSEGLRAAVQNAFHRLIDDGQIPRRDRAPRLYVRLALNDGGGLY